jgi:shikimate kinase
MTSPTHVVLMGLMGAGKTTVGRALAGSLGRPFVDNDELLVRRLGRTARDVEVTAGADALHGEEANALLEALDSRVPSVVSAAAAAPLAPDVRSALAAQLVIYLRAHPDVLASRVATDARTALRPLVDRDASELLREQFDERDEVYTAVADLVVDVDNQTPDEVVDVISRAVAAARPRRASPES